MPHVLLDRPCGYEDISPIAVATPIRTVEAFLKLQLPFTPSPAMLPGPAMLLAELPDSLVMKLYDLHRTEVDDLSALLLAAFTVFSARYTHQPLIRLGVAAQLVSDDHGLVVHHTDFAEGGAAAPSILTQQKHGGEPLVQSVATPIWSMVDADLASAPHFTAVLQHIHDHLNRATEQHSHAELQLPVPQQSDSIGFFYQCVPENCPQPVALSRPPLAGDLRLEVLESARSLQITWFYRADRFEAATIAQMHSDFLTLLDGIAMQPDRPISMLPLLNPTQRNRLLFEWNATATPYPDTQCIHTLFEAQAARTPDAIALVFGEQQITYRVLNRRANRVARRLRDLNIGREVMVGLFAADHRPPTAGLGLASLGRRPGDLREAATDTLECAARRRRESPGRQAAHLDSSDGALDDISQCVRADRSLDHYNTLSDHLRRVDRRIPYKHTYGAPDCEQADLHS